GLVETLDRVFHRREIFRKVARGDRAQLFVDADFRAFESAAEQLDRAGDRAHVAVLDREDLGLVLLDVVELVLGRFLVLREGREREKDDQCNAFHEFSFGTIQMMRTSGSAVWISMRETATWGVNSLT